MGMSGRLDLLFAQDQALLQINTGLRVPAAASGPAKENEVVVGEEVSLQGEGNRAGTSAFEIAGLGSTSSLHKVGQEEHNAQGAGKSTSIFESGDEPPSSLIAQSFCPAAAIAKLPYKYLRGGKVKAIGSRFFDQGQFWQRKWDLYYIFPPPDVSPNALLLLPAAQVQQLLNEINKELNINLTLPMDPDLGLLLPFAEDDTHRPRLLGQSISRETKDQLVAGIPESPSKLTDPIESVDGKEYGESTKAFRAKLEAGLDASKTKSKVSKARKRNEKIDRQREWTQSLKRAQCYLGLHPHRSSHPGGTGVGYETVNHNVSEGQPATLIPLSTLQLEQPAPFPFAYEPIFVCIDVESNERRHTEVTEIGISTLDTLDLVNTAPGEGGGNWIRWIRSRHLRIKESAHVVNHTFVSGCPNRFEFGESEFVSIRDASKAVEGCFNPPYSAQIPVKFVEQGPSSEKAKITIETAIREYKLRPRNIVLVGHNVQSDIEYLHILGSNLFSDKHASHKPKSSQRHHNKDAPQNSALQVLDTLDTANMFQVLKRDTHNRALDAILNSLGIIGWNLHNAGNDARYTLESMVRIIINSRTALGNNPDHASEGDSKDWAMESPKATCVDNEQNIHAHEIATPDEIATPYELAWKAEVERRVAETVAESEMRVREDCKIWEIVTGWDSEYPPTADDFDGGEPKGIVLPKQRQKLSGDDYKGFDKRKGSFKRVY